jgi:hypothetical protein
LQHAYFREPPAAAGGEEVAAFTAATLQRRAQVQLQLKQAMQRQQAALDDAVRALAP